jgi:hypothetical protein
MAVNFKLHASGLRPELLAHVVQTGQGDDGTVEVLVIRDVWLGASTTGE